MGLPGLAREFAALEEKLGRAGGKVTQAEIESLKAGYAHAEGPLREFAGKVSLLRPFGCRTGSCLIH